MTYLMTPVIKAYRYAIDSRIIAHYFNVKCNEIFFSQCGRKVDVFKFWLMLKARGISGFERLIDNSMEKAQYLTHEISKRTTFRLVMNNFQYTNVCFWYIPSHLQMKSENESWWNEIYKIVPQIKYNMIKEGSIMINYAPLPSKGIGNFFRMTFTCFPPPTETSINYLLDEIERIAKITENDKK